MGPNDVEKLGTEPWFQRGCFILGMGLLGGSSHKLVGEFGVITPLEMA